MNPALVDAAVRAISGAGCIVVLVAVLDRGRIREGLTMALTLWMAAGLLRLTGAPTWDRIAASAAVVLVRQIVTFGMKA